jgi:DNA invertase Pin-like site-specific DNA recombinase
MRVLPKGAEQFMKISEPAHSLVPAAEYVRMSDEQQQYSIVNQQDAIREYAQMHGFAIVKTYADPDKTGVEATRRTALQELLKDVISGNAGYRAILVYDVSRWGRFQDNDEGAHYEFLCRRSGIPLHYCAEPFANDGTATSSLIKALKRSMAAEFSRELGEKVYRGKIRLVKGGFWVGGKPGFGYRRMMVSDSGKRKQLMQRGECKNIKTDRVILVPGPAKEQACIHLIFSMASEGRGATAISRELNRQCMFREGEKRWAACSVAYILRNPKYYGCNAWNRTSQRLQQKVHSVGPQEWIMKECAFAPIISRDLFERAAISRAKSSDQWWSDKEILRCVRRVLKVKGRLSETLLQKARGMPALSTIKRRLGNCHELYDQVGYHLDTVDCINNAYCEATLKLRRKVVSSIHRLFPDHIEVTHQPGKTRSVLVVDHHFMVSVVLSRARRSRKGTLGWPVSPNDGERTYITLVCTMNKTQDRVLRYFLLERTDNFKSACYGDSFLRTAVRLRGLSDFYRNVQRLWEQRIEKPLVGMGSSQKCNQ